MKFSFPKISYQQFGLDGGRTPGSYSQAQAVKSKPKKKPAKKK